ncbi:hypothetical protein PNOK_0795500 [Pyrrhoderma noxium]|uniref:Uncharacterized protein n=1 Tax=Pyrrhoderma noxium TaxID=2282107 RepID=A0A286U9U5_9AGAM|nr:hypothetical protein PNOK_0795500 [Pyrrhoderma noxium]
MSSSSSLSSLQKRFVARCGSVRRGPESRKRSSRYMHGVHLKRPWGDVTLRETGRESHKTKEAPTHLLSDDQPRGKKQAQKIKLRKRGRRIRIDLLETQSNFGKPSRHLKFSSIGRQFTLMWTRQECWLFAGISVGTTPQH